MFFVMTLASVALSYSADRPPSAVVESQIAATAEQVLSVADTAAPLETDTRSAWRGTHESGTSDPGVLMNRARVIGAGTTVLPVLTPMRMWGGWSVGDWFWMAHGKAILGRDLQGGPRGKTSWVAENNLMLMGSRPWGPGLLDLHLMGSLEPFTVPPGGTPQLLQSGGEYRGAPIIDAKDPHNIIMELAARYSWNLDTRTALFIYGGPIGVPALGPTPYMHRPSAAENAWAPLAHDLQDGNHISDGVVTVGARRDAVQWEVSAFNARDTDAYRYTVDFGPLDSYATRLTYFPGSNWSLQASAGRLHTAGYDLRLTASALNVSPTAWGTLSTQLIWGQGTDLTGLSTAVNSYGLESELDGENGDHVYGRYELVDRPDITSGTPRATALTLGYLRDVWNARGLSMGVGADATALSLDSSLVNLYGDNPLSCRIYLRLAPPLARVGQMGDAAGMKR
jgi:hypothetical protein